MLVLANPIPKDYTGTNTAIIVACVCVLVVWLAYLLMRSRRARRELRDRTSGVQPDRVASRVKRLSLSERNTPPR